MSELIRRRFTVTGQVQGVGFRPFVYRIALDRGLTGFVLNSPEGVIVEAQGPPEQVQDFGRALEFDIPPLARIVSFTAEEIEPAPDEAGFAIRASAGGEGHHVLISPDIATCADCLADMTDPGNRRFMYPFTNCTNCGPRYTITRSVPYDRPYTSMACFPLCEECAREYEDPLDRRFHAQPNACWSCGPTVWHADASGRELARGVDAMRQVAAALAGGEIAALKGLGGFHLACNAADPAVVHELRRRKNRWEKPLAVMVPDLDVARALCEVGQAEADLLSGMERPIVLCRARADGALTAQAVRALSPDNDFLGLMLPYTPLHHLLFSFLARLDQPPAPAALVMTSGNMSSEPIALGNREALARLGHIADRFLLHNRDILIRSDDSVLRCLPESGEHQFFRRSRGYTPKPIFLREGGPPVLGTGPELKNTLCITKDDQAFVSQHIGDMENLETFGFYREIALHLQDILQTVPELVVHDLHPDYMTTRWAREQDRPTLALQHHYAHIHSVLAEHRYHGPAIGLAVDGTGYGEDGTIWGGECLFVNTETLEHERLAHVSRLPLPGGEAAVKQPWRMAQSYLHALGVRDPEAGPQWPWLAEHGPAARMLPMVLDKQLNSPLTTSCGRLFDAVSAMLGIKLAIAYEGQAAIALESAQDPAERGAYPCPVKAGASPAELDTLTLFSHVYADWRAGVPAGVISRRFHLGIVAGLADLARHFADRTGVTVVALSGGVMQNLTMTVELPRALAARRLTPLRHVALPPNDGCISLGQAVWGKLTIR
jgi:hydrogenase maturation protein HypF